MAIAILVTLIVAVGGVLTSSVAAHAVARERTGAEQCVNAQVEVIRAKAYDRVGTPSGNPPGEIPATSACSGINATANVTIVYVDDPTPTSYATAANYKKVTIRVLRDRDSKLLLRSVTYVAPPARAPYGGINNAIINIQVVDLGNSQPYQGATVSIAHGPSSDRSDSTDGTGTVSFAALTPNPTSGAQSYYDVTVTASGYQTLAADVPSGSATPPETASHIQLAPSDTSTSSIRIFKPATINVNLRGPGGVPYSGGATLKVLSSFTGTTYTVSVPAGQSSKAITALGGQSVVPGATYTLHGYTTTGMCADPDPSPVPDSGYPSNTSETFTLDFASCPMGTLAVNAQQLGTNAPCTPVLLTDGPNDISVSATTDASGNATFTNVPSGSGYTIAAGSRFGQSGTTTASVSTGTTTSKSVTLADPTLATLNVTVSSAGQNVGSGVPVTLAGGACSIASETVNTNGSGVASFTHVPVGSGFPSGSGYTASVINYVGISGSVNVSSIASGTNAASLILPTGTINVAVSWAGQSAGNQPVAANVTITGGPFGATYTGATNGSGVASVLVAPTTPSYPYTVKASKNGSSLVTGTPVTTLPSGGTVSSSVDLTPTKTFTITIQRGGVNASTTGVNISITGGPNGNAGSTPAYTFAGTTNSSGVLVVGPVPQGTSGSTYTIKANLSTCGASGSNRSGSKTANSNTGSNTAVTVNMTTSTCPFSPLP